MEWADTPRGLAERSDVVFSMLTNADAVEAVVRGDDGVLAGLPAGGVLVEMSTIATDRSRALAAQVAEAGGTMLDAPVSGSTATLAEGQLSIMVGGDAAAFERVRPILLDIGPKVTHVGDNGQALVMKVAINLALIVQVVSFCEGVALAEKQGIDRETAKDVVKAIKESKLKVQAAIQGDQVRVSSKSKDTLQEIMQGLRDEDFGLPLQFTNRR
jgi:3-hydroxyisobutyrate dehydrogenase-like beta-hydroxyacid dehydrogenase